MRKYVSVLCSLCMGLFSAHCGEASPIVPLGTGGTAPIATGGSAATGGGLATGGSAPVSGGMVQTGGVVMTGGVLQTGGAAMTGGTPVPGAVVTRNPAYASLAAPMQSALAVADADTVSPAPPAGWHWFDIPGTYCRDGSGNGLYINFADDGSVDADKLLIFYEGGGACTTEGFCGFNPSNIGEHLSGIGQDVLGTAFGVAQGRQQPGVYQEGAVTGIFDEGNAANPFKDWNKVYIPYCTGDVHFGTNESGMIFDNPANLIPALPGQKMVGYDNSKIFMGHLAATFGAKITAGLVTGSSAGSFGAALNFSMIQDTFDGVLFHAVLDSGAPFKDSLWPACQQQKWRNIFGLDGSLPPDCTQCFNADGGGMLGMADYLIDKHPNSNIAIVTTVNDEVIRLFFTPGENECAIIDTADPVELTIGQITTSLYPAEKYEQGMNALRTEYVSTGRMATYFMPGVLHQHMTRPRFFEAAAGGVTIADFVSDFLDGKMLQVGP